MTRKIKDKPTLKSRRAIRTRARLHGTKKRPRLSVSRSLRAISAQLINDDKGETLAAVSDKGLASALKPVERAKEVGKKIAEIAKEKGIESVIFDRGSNRYHGRVAAVAEGAREGGLKI